MPHIVVIDSLARSGTTLLAALINSQRHSASLRAMFYEGLACQLGSWPYGLAKLPLIKACHLLTVRGGEHGLVGQALPRQEMTPPDWLAWLRLKLRLPVTLDAAFLLSTTLERAGSLKQSALFDEAAWRRVLDRPVFDLDDLDKLYQDICAEKDLQVLGLRWNQGLFYALKWLRRPEHYWCTIVRNPLDRAASAKLTHNWPFEKSLAASLAYAEKITAMQGQANFRCIYYEDLVDNPEGTMRQLFNWLGKPQETIELEKVYGQHGAPYRSETAELMQETGDHRVGRDYSGIYKSAIDRYQGVIPQSTSREFMSRLASSPVYSRYWPDIA